MFNRFKPLLETMGASVVRCGDVGAGNTTKLANQIIVACNIQALALSLIHIFRGLFISSAPT